MILGVIHEWLFIHGGGLFEFLLRTSAEVGTFLGGFRVSYSSALLFVPIHLGWDCPVGV